jgi:hypothetical protein
MYTLSTTPLYHQTKLPLSRKADCQIIFGIVICQLIFNFAMSCQMCCGGTGLLQSCCGCRWGLGTIQTQSSVLKPMGKPRVLGCLYFLETCMWSIRCVVVLCGKEQMLVQIWSHSRGSQSRSLGSVSEAICGWWRHPRVTTCTSWPLVQMFWRLLGRKCLKMGLWVLNGLFLFDPGDHLFYVNHLFYY